MADEDVVVARIPVIINNWSKDREPQKTVPTGIIPPVPADSPPTTTLFASAAVPTLPQKSRKLYLIQYPLRPSDRPLLVDNSLSTQQEQKLPVRIKPSVDILQMLFPLDKQSDHYSAERGSQLRKGLESAYIVENAPASALQQLQQQSQKQQQGKINGAEPFSAMDCTADPAERYMAEKNRWTTGGIPMEAHKVLEGQSDSGTIMVGWWSEDCSALHLTPLDAVLQSRPHLKHIDAIEALQKQQQQASRRSDQQTDESGVSEAEDQAAVAAAVANKRMALQKKQDVAAVAQFTTKRHALQRAIEEEEWIPLDYQSADRHTIDQTLCAPAHSVTTSAGSQIVILTTKTQPADYFQQFGQH